MFDGRDASLTKRFFVEAGDNTLEPGDTVVQKRGKPGHDSALDGAGLTRR